jgi:formylglycine-generating enzyme required for sulfatase activity
MKVHLAAVFVLVSALTGACRGRSNGGSSGAATVDEDVPPPPSAPIPLRPRAVDSGTPRAEEPVRPLPAAGAVVRVEGGAYRLGSTPGDPGRDPAVEADLVPVELGGFDIDALPYPNDPHEAPRTGAARDEAERLCRERGRRLCSEVEWERACRGAGSTIFPGGDAWDAQTCGRGELNACATREGVFAMGTRFAEWTRDNLEDRAIIRGASRDGAAGLHRCASRRTAVPGAAGLEVGFRCCGGTTPSVTYPREVSRRPFRDEPMNATQVSALIASVPELERLHLRDGLAMFLPGAIAEVLNHGATSAEMHPEYTFTVNPVRWSPTFGEEVLVLAGKSRVGSWIAALWVLPDGRYRHAASFLLKDDAVSIALAYGQARREVAWATCWNCGGEYGAVTYTEDNRVVIVQR